MSIDINKRWVETLTVKEISDGSVLYEGGTGHGLFEEMKGVVKVGDEVVLETKNYSMITGIGHHGKWLLRKTDEDLEREHREFVEDLRRRRQAELNKNRAAWQARTDALPEWIRERIERFQQSPAFEEDGWGYELVIAELAVIYAEHPDKNAPEAMEYARKEGTSGNQHDFAFALAKEHLEGRSLKGSVSGLSPLTGDPYYEKEN